MKNIIFTIIILALGATLFISGNAQASSTICRGDIIPTGQVVIRTTNHFSCGSSNYSDNQYIIDYPATSGNTRICNGLNSYIPSGYIIIANIYNGACNIGNGNSINGSTITKAINQQYNVCSNSPIPANYSVINTIWTSSCQIGTGLGTNAVTITKN